MVTFRAVALQAPMSSTRPKWFGPTFTANYKPEEGMVDSGLMVDERSNN